MPTEAQINANRTYAQKSTGPKTDEGKAVSSRNAIRHGLLCMVIPIDTADYRELLVGLYTALKPEDELQRMIVDQIAVTTIRLRRAWNAEQNALVVKLGHHADGPDPRPLPLHEYLESAGAQTILRYEIMLNRLLQKLMDRYKNLKTDPNWKLACTGDSPYIRTEKCEHAASETPVSKGIHRDAEKYYPEDVAEDENYYVKGPIATVELPREVQASDRSAPQISRHDAQDAPEPQQPAQPAKQPAPPRFKLRLKPPQSRRTVQLDYHSRKPRHAETPAAAC